MEPNILEKYEALPAPLKTEVAHYIEFLLEKYRQQESPQNPTTQDSSGYGSWTGDIIISEDFDKPLEDLKDYM